MTRPVIDRRLLAPGYEISRVIKGGWQLAGGHGQVDPAQAMDDMRHYAQAGITTFDCADIYTGVEELIGQFLRRHRDDLRRGALPDVQVHTKYVPDLDSLPTLTKGDVERTIDRSLRRLGIERLDLVQFHWWDYDIPSYVETAMHLADLQQAGKIRHLGVTNFDVPHLDEIVQAGVPVISNQVQYSLLDGRPARDMAAFCERQGISLLCYGTIAGGFLSDRYLGAPEPEGPLGNRSLAKYALIIDEFGGWDLFQALLRALRRVAEKYGTTLATVAVRWALQQAAVAAAIVGVRHAGHLATTLEVFGFELDAEDLAAIEQVTHQTAGPAGDIYDLERKKGGRHAVIMKYNLNRT
jgi:aryl-alcohol dehydrogenase-like predicted oxidoreductase